MKCRRECRPWKNLELNWKTSGKDKRTTRTDGTIVKLRMERGSGMQMGMTIIWKRTESDKFLEYNGNGTRELVKNCTP